MSHTRFRGSSTQGRIAWHATPGGLTYCIMKIEIAKSEQRPSRMLATRHAWYANDRVSMRHHVHIHSRTTCSHPVDLTHLRSRLPSAMEHHECNRSGAPLPCQAISHFTLHFYTLAGLLHHRLAGLFIKRCFATRCRTVRGLQPAVSLRPLVSKVPWNCIGFGPL